MTGKSPNFFGAFKIKRERIFSDRQPGNEGAAPFLRSVLVAVVQDVGVVELGLFVFHMISDHRHEPWKL